ncbi:MAG: HEPN domain-containing protein [Candidatus Aenigmatarchaeota archaeon]
MGVNVFLSFQGFLSIMENAFAKDLWNTANEDLKRAKDALNNNDWQGSVYWAQQAVEKGFKSLGVIFLNLDENTLRTKYSHNTLKLYGDILKTFINNVSEPAISNLKKVGNDSLEKAENEQDFNKIAINLNIFTSNYSQLYIITEMNRLANELPKELVALENDKIKIWKISMEMEQEVKDKSDLLTELEDLTKKVNTYFSLNFKLANLQLGSFKGIVEKAVNVSNRNELIGILGDLEAKVKERFPDSKIDLISSPMSIESFNLMHLLVDLKEDTKYILFLDAHESLSRYPKEKLDFDMKKVYSENSQKVVEFVEKAGAILDKLKLCIESS